MKKTVLTIPAMLVVLALAVSACGRGSAPEPTSAPTEAPAPVSAGDAAHGEELFTQTCAACHGPEGEGVTGLGKDMTTSEFIAGKSDEELVEFIKVGRPTDDPLNTTGVAMLPKGGNPSLSDEDLYDIVAYIRTLQK
jgi:mono/diheme cytochrome c family protein